MQQLVSVVLPAFNHERFIQATIESLIAQSYQRVELIVIDDGSSDKTPDRILTMKEKCERRFEKFIFRSRSNQGLATTINEALGLANGTYIYHIASDDVADAVAIEVLVTAIDESPYIGAVCGDADFIDGDDHRIAMDTCIGKVTSFITYWTSWRPDFRIDQDFGTYKSLLGGNYVPGGILVRRSVYEKVGLYDPRYFPEDHTMWLTIAKYFQLRLVNQVLFHYRIHATNSMKLKGRALAEGHVRTICREKSYAIEKGLRNLWERTMFRLFLENTRARRVNIAIQCAKCIGWPRTVGLGLRHLTCGDAI